MKMYVKEKEVLLLMPTVLRTTILPLWSDQTVLKVINDWAERHPKEVLILALSHFKGFDKKIETHLHTNLINFIKTLFGAKLCLRRVKYALFFH